MSLTVIILARSLVPSRAGRRLVPEPREVATIAEARVWISRMVPTWLDPQVLLPSEDGVIALIADDEGHAARSIEYGRAPGAKPIEHGRASLREMAAVRTNTKTTATTTREGDR